VKGIGLAGFHDTLTLLRSADLTAVAGPGTAVATSAGPYNNVSSSSSSIDSSNNNRSSVSNSRSSNSSSGGDSSSKTSNDGGGSSAVCVCVDRVITQQLSTYGTVRNRRQLHLLVHNGSAAMHYYAILHFESQYNFQVHSSVLTGGQLPS
jgi:hypothetical protein